MQVVAINTIIGIIQEGKADKAADALNKMMNPVATGEPRQFVQKRCLTVAPHAPAGRALT